MGARIHQLKQYAWLFLAMLLVPVTFHYYTEFSNTRMRCHVPSTWPLEHLVFELFPYVIISIILLFSWLFSVRAMKSTELIGQTLLVVTIAFEYSVFLFAIIYYQYGLMVQYDHEDLFVANTYVNSQIFSGQGDLAQIMIDQAAQDTPDTSEPGRVVLAPTWRWQQGLADEGALFYGNQMLQFTEDAEIHHPIATNKWDYLLFSLSVALPGVPRPNLAICPRANHFQIGQVFWGLVLGLIAIYLAGRIDKTGPARSHTNHVEESPNTPMLVQRVARGHEPDVFHVNGRTIGGLGKRRHNLRAVRARFNRR
ncbi:hypothetical protein [Phaeobacter sp. J2-8]|uniref:hypothetical protein n=1 Tax=Phaeobacter sp. J2-8 TaxID=2931394 RepID=UPI001FD5F4A2|nr:hypothetical protein [Phaeobacter sp. J2-8]MCJ7871788.1 hypothetical protein [Phaeobacter sp. J2-8]